MPHMDFSVDTRPRWEEDEHERPPASLWVQPRWEGEAGGERRGSRGGTPPPTLPQRVEGPVCKEEADKAGQARGQVVGGGGAREEKVR